MIKIIKHGNAYMQKHTCICCKCEFEFTKDEIKYVKAKTHCRNQIDTENMSVIFCPECMSMCILTRWNRNIK